MFEELARIVSPAEVAASLPTFARIGEGRGVKDLQKIFDGVAAPDWLSAVYPVVRRNIVSHIKEEIVESVLEDEKRSLVVIGSPKAKRNFLILLVGALVVVVIALFVLYYKRKKAYGEIYGIGDLLKEVWGLIKKGAKYVATEIIWNALKKVIGTAIVIIIIAFVVRFLIPPSWLVIDEKSSYLKQVLVHVVTFITGKHWIGVEVPADHKSGSKSKSDARTSSPTP